MANTPSSRQRGGRPEVVLNQAEGGEVLTAFDTDPVSESLNANPADRCDITFIKGGIPLEKRDSKPYQESYTDTSQSFNLVNDDLSLFVTGYRENNSGLLIYRLLGFLTLGIGFLLGRWFPRFPIRLGARVTSLANASFVVVLSQYDQYTKVPVVEIPFDGSFAQFFSDKSGYLDFKKSNSQLNFVRLFQYRFMTFILNPDTGLFCQLSNWQDNRWAHISDWHDGLGEKELNDRKVFFPSNVIDIPEKSIFSLLVDEILHPFFVFQVFSIILWCSENYYKYAICIALITAISVVSTLIQTRSNFKRIQMLSRFECTTNVLRNGVWSTISSSELVPGDLVDITHSELSVFPCDLVLLQGDCIVGEGMLTGESVPVSKSPLERSQLLYQELGPNQKGLSNFSPELSRSMLFSGTQIIRARGGFAPPSAGCERNFRAVAMVVRTGFNTTKGGLVRSILFPRPSQFKFYRDSFRFIGVSAIIALIGFAVTLVKLISLGMKPYLITIRALDLATVIIPPALPATMSVGVSFALSRLQANGVYCISPTRINVSGKVDVVCFDKTGTLTEEGLDVLGAQDVAGDQLGSLVADVSTLSIPLGAPLSLLHCISTCHSIKVVDNERLGDPLDLRMLEATRWVLEEGGAAAVTNPSAQLVGALVRPPNQPRFSLDTLQNLRKAENFQELAILHTFEFVSNLRRMSVVVKQWRSSVATLYTKGAPEVIATLCRPDSLPKDFSTQLKAYTQKGYRVIACAGRALGELSLPQIQFIDQTEAETDLTFLGFVVFENRLKAATPDAIAALHQADIRQVMCTGDNPLTAVSVAFECGLIPHDSLIFSPKLYGSTILWESINHDSLGDYSDAPLLLNPDTLQPPKPHHGNYAIAVTGDCFRQIMDNSPQHVINFMLAKAQVFARMSPEEKQELVEQLHELDYCVAFCGDGANDCGALRAADVGLSLSEAEASVAAPFTSKTLDISSVPLLIREGRAALVTSFSCFKYMGLYSIIQSTSIMFLYQYGSNLGDNQYLLIDLFTILPIAVAMGRTSASFKLYPGSPSASLVSKKMLSSFLGQCILQILFQLAVYLILIKQDWFEVPDFDPEDPNVPSMINTSLFHLSSFQYIWGALVFSVGHPFRRPIFTNLPFMATSVSLTLFYLWILFNPIEFVVEQLELVDIRTSFRYLILGFVIGNLFLSFVYEQYIASLVVLAIEKVQHSCIKLCQPRHHTGDHFGFPKKKFQQIEYEATMLRSA